MQTVNLSRQESSLYAFDDCYHDEKIKELRVAANYLEETIELCDHDGFVLRVFEVTL